MADHKTMGDNIVSVSSMMEVQSAAGDLAAAEFKLLLDKASHDLAVFKNYKSKLQSVESAMYHARLAHLQRRAEVAQNTVSRLLRMDRGKGDLRLSRYQLCYLTGKARVLDVMDDFQKFVGQLASIHNIP